MHAVLVLLAILAAPALAQPPGCRDGVPVSELVTDYACDNGTRAMVSDGAPANWWDGQRWRAPEPVWNDGELRGVPGSLVWRAEPDRLTAYRRDGALVGALGWRGATAGPAFIFDWHDLPCSITAGTRDQKLACTVTHSLGRRTLRVPVSGEVSVTPEGAALIGGLWRLDRLVVIGADGEEYPGVVSAWRLGPGTLAVRVDDRRLPAAAFPYVLDPSVGPKLPGTCASATGVGTVAWTSPGNATASDNTRATANLALNAQTNWLKCTNFGFVDPPLGDDKIVKGIVAEVEASRSGTGATMAVRDIRAVKADGTIASTSVATGACITAWTNNDAFFSCGSSTNLWGETWAAADIRDVDFGVAVSARNTGATTRDARIDVVRVTIYYIPPAGRVFLSGWDTYSTGAGVNPGEGGVEVGSPEYVAGAARTGGAGLRLSTTASTAESWTPPTNVNLDSDLADRAFARWYWSNTPDIPTGQSVVVAAMKQDGEIGCYLKLARSSDGCFSYQTLYHGTGPADLDFGTFVASSSPIATCVSTLAGAAVGFGQVTTATTVACPLYINGTLAQDYALALASDCSGSACDLNTVTLGSPATGAVANYSAFPAYTLDLDDFAIDNLADPGLGAVRAIRPNGAGDSTVWSSSAACTGGSSGWDCLIDWASGAADACTGSGTTTRQRSSNTGEDLWNFGDLSPALAATQSVAGVRYVLWACENSGTGSSLRLRWKSSGTTVSGIDDTLSAGTTKWMSGTYAASFLGDGTTPWTESDVNALQLGYEKYVSGGTDTRASAALAYVDVQDPAPAADRNLQDWNGDGMVTVATGCDSITAGTKTSVCVSTDDTVTTANPGGACRGTCTSDADCDGGICQPTGVCQMGCEVNSDCTCGTSAICGTAFNWVNQLSLKAPQIDNLINCGRNTMPSQWWVSVLPAIIANPYSHAPPCRLIRGAWGHCSSTTTQDCAVDGDCPPSQTCVPHAVDYVIDMCGGNEVINYGPAECSAASNILGLQVPSSNDRWGVQACPQAVTTPTPGAFQVARKTCTTDADCTGDANYGSLSRCKGYCAGHEDPLWPCNFDDQCGECASPSSRNCVHQGTCVDSNGASVLQGGNVLAPHYEKCSSDTDCSTGTCVSYESGNGNYDDAYGTCGLCTHRDCVTGGTKYCTPSCASVTCSTDADCSPAGTVGGICDTGTGRCKACGSGLGYVIDTSAATQVLDARRVNNSLGQLTPDLMASRDAALTSTIRSNGARRIASTYARSFLLGADEGIKNLFQTLAKTKLRNAPLVVDAHNASRYYDDRIAGGTDGTILLPDGVHNVVGGATVSSQLISASVNLIYPVCSGNSAELCGACDVPCATDVQCNKPVTGASPTPTPKAGACRTATPAVNVCGCSVDADCAAGCTCEDVQPGAGTDNRCICEAMASCPVGDSSRARKRVASDTTCSSGSCTEERVPPLCTMAKNRCTTTADCLGYARGDVCAADGVWQACENNADCTRDGGVYADPVCAAGTPVVGTSPTPKSRVCQAPTPTP